MKEILDRIMSRVTENFAEKAVHQVGLAFAIGLVRQVVTEELAHASKPAFVIHQDWALDLISALTDMLGDPDRMGSTRYRQRDPREWCLFVTRVGDCLELRVEGDEIA